MRYYFSTLTGVGTDANAFRPVIEDLILANAPNVACIGVDGRSDFTSTNGWFFVAANLSLAQHNLINGNPGVTFLPTYNGGTTNPLVLSDTISLISAGNKSIIRAEMEARGIPATQLTNSDTIRKALTLIIGRALIKHTLGSDDITESLDAIISSINAGRRSLLIDKLTQIGFAFNAVKLTDLVRDVLVDICNYAGTIQLGSVVP